MIEILGAVIVSRKEYLHEDIALLVGKSIKGWKIAGDQSDEESSIVVGSRIFEGANMLPDALAYIEQQQAKAL